MRQMSVRSEKSASMTVSIRRARKGDAKAIVDSWNESFRKGHLKFTATRQRTREDVKRFDKRFFKNKRNHFTFVAVENSKIIGHCALSGSARGRTSHRAELSWYVHHDYVGKGIASELLDAVLREARRRGFKRVEAEIAVENIASIRLAKRFGFGMEGRRKSGLALDNGRYADTFIFGKIVK